MIIDHIGIATRSLEQAIPHWEQTFGYTQATKVITNTRQQVNVVFLEKENSLPVKLIEPTNSASPVYRFASRGGGLHHLCFRCNDLTQEINRLTGQGLRVLAAPQPGEAFENEDIAFIFANHGLNIELIATDKRAGRLTP